MIKFARPIRFPIILKGWCCVTASNDSRRTCYNTCACATRDLGWGLLSQFSPFRYFPIFSTLWKHCYVDIWQVLPQLSCRDTRQIGTWFQESDRYFHNIKKAPKGEITKRSFSNPHPKRNMTSVRTGKSWFPSSRNGFIQCDLVTHVPS